MDRRKEKQTKESKKVGQKEVIKGWKKNIQEGKEGS